MRITVAPLPARPSAIADPMPRDDPVTSAVRPVKSKGEAMDSNLGRRRPWRSPALFGSGVDHAEEVALRIGEDDEVGARRILPVDLGRAEG